MDSADATDARRMEMIYTIEDTPPWYLCVFLGLQVLAHHVFTQMLYHLPVHVWSDVSCRVDVLYISPTIHINFAAVT